MHHMTTPEVSKYLGIPEATLRWWRHKGDEGPKSFTLGRRRVVYRKEDVDRWLEEQYAKAEAL